jgi:alkanesulfonate monooxygenase SsuD/methylene tetrahydromethanopterin reductase-like flavin-dependent oxidoreductase (luciferase family)
VEVIAALLRGGPVTHEGRRFHLTGAYNHPAPAQADGPPIWVGGKGGDRGLRLVARHGTGWNTVWKWTVAAYAGRSAALERICEEEGRDPATVRRSIGLYTLVGEDRADLDARYAALQRWSPGGALEGLSVDDYARDTLTGTVEECAERLSRFGELGVEEVIVGAGPVPFSVFDWSHVELVAERLLPAAHAA